MSFLRAENLVKGTRIVGAQVVLDDHDLFGIRIMKFRKHLHEHGIFTTGSALKNRTDPFADLRLKSNKQVTDAVPFIFIVFKFDLAWFHRNWLNNIGRLIARDVHRN